MLALMSVATARGIRDGRVRRGGRRRRRRHRARRGRAAAGARRRAARSSASPTCRRWRPWRSAISGSSKRAPLRDAADAARWPAPRSSGSTARSWWRSCAACWAPTAGTRRPGDTPKSCCEPRRIWPSARAGGPWEPAATRPPALVRIERRQPACRPRQASRRSLRCVPEVHGTARLGQAHQAPRAPPDARRHRDHRPLATSTAWRPRTSSSPACRRS